MKQLVCAKLYKNARHVKSKSQNVEMTLHPVFLGLSAATLTMDQFVDPVLRDIKAMEG